MAAADPKMCAICQQVMNVGVDDLKALGCSHVFHSGCLDEYSAATGKPIGLLVCPCCKMPPTEDVAFSDFDPAAQGSGSTGPVAADLGALDGEELSDAGADEDDDIDAGADEDDAPDDDDEVIATDATGTARAKPRAKGAAKKAAAKPKGSAKRNAAGKRAGAKPCAGEPADADAPTAKARGKAKRTAAKALAKAAPTGGSHVPDPAGQTAAAKAHGKGKARGKAAAVAKAPTAKALAKAAATGGSPEVPGGAGTAHPKAKGRGKAAAVSNASSSCAPPGQATEPPAEETEETAVEPEPASVLASVAFGMVVCSSCGRPNSFSQCRVLSKGRQSWRCNGCNVKSVQLRRALGQWPTDGFNMLSADSINVCVLARIRNTSIVACLGVQHGKRHSRS